MIEVLLNKYCIDKLRLELKKAKTTEIGGVLAAEQVGDGRFMVVDLSVQRDGTSSRFERDPERHRAFIRRFHDRMGNQPERFNYLGEWHSHPSYYATPSNEDFQQMQELIEEVEQRSNFLVLMVIKLGDRGELRGSVYGFRPRLAPVRGRFGSVEEGETQEESPLMVIQL
jgi:integrative and conjugative element protein (TIGR02256 family)